MFANARNFFDKLFKHKNSEKYSYIDYNFSESKYAGFGKNAYLNETVRSAVNIIAQQVASLSIQHFIGKGNEKKRVENSVYERLLSVKPNAYMTAYDFWCKMITQREIYGDAYAYIDWDTSVFPNVPKAIYPVIYNDIKVYQYQGDAIAEFTIHGSQKIKIFFEELIHLTKYFNNNLLTSDGNSPLYTSLDMIKVAQDGFKDSLNLANKIRGIHKQKIGMLDKDDIKKETDSFVNRYNEAVKNGGIIGMDMSEDYIAINPQPMTVNSQQMKEVREEVYRYLNISEKIMTSDFTDDDWSAFFNNVIAPIALQLSQELTIKCFTERERGFGNEILFSTSFIEHMSFSNKIKLVQTTKDIGVLTIPEIRKMFGKGEPNPDEERKVSLNYVNADNQDNYQSGGNENGT